MHFFPKEHYYFYVASRAMAIGQWSRDLDRVGDENGHTLYASQTPGQLPEQW
jgi:hypothetical protein